jgi:hypothetical protein
MNTSLKTALYTGGCAIFYATLSWTLGPVEAGAPPHDSSDTKWVDTGIIDDSGNTVYLNTHSLQKLPVSGLTIARFKGFYTPWNDWIGINFAVDCKNGVAGNFISSNDLFTEGKLTPPIRGSIGEGLMKLLCTGNPEGDL